MHTFTKVFESCASVIFKTYFRLIIHHCMSFSLARATLVLIPLLGVHEVVFTLLIDECMDRRSRYARNFINLTLSSFQVTLTKFADCIWSISRSGSICDVFPFSRDSWLLHSTVLLMQRYASFWYSL